VTNTHEQIIPEGWALATVGDLVEFKYGKGLPAKRRSPGEVPVYGSNGIVGKHDVSVTDGPAIIIGRKGTVGAVHFCKGPCWPIDTTYFIDDFSAVDARFLARLLESLGMSELDTSTAIPGLNRNDAYAQEVLLPPLAEQERIVAKVEALLSRVRSVRQRLAAVPGILKHFRQAVLAHACSGKLTEDWRAIRPDLSVSRHDVLARIRARSRKHSGYKRPRAAEHECPIELPGEWAWASIEELASGEPRSMQSGPFGSNLLHSEFQQTGVLAIGIDNVQDGWFSEGSQHRISPEKYNELKKYTARPLDVLVTVMGTVGRVCLVPEDLEPAIITKHVYRTTIDQVLAIPHYIAFALRDDSIVQSQIQGSVIGQTRPGINGRILKGIGVPLPPLAEQQEIVRRVEALFALADSIEQRVQGATRRGEMLTQSILAKAFRGELVPTEAELARAEGRGYETAEQLLARIREELAQRKPEKKTRRKTSKRKKVAMKKLDGARVQKVIQSMPADTFSFADLRKKLPGDYDALKDILFALLEDSKSGLEQVFDEQAKAMRFRRRTKT